MDNKDFDYEKIYFDQNFLYSHNSLFYIKTLTSREKHIFPIKLLLPDYIYENFNLLEEPQKKALLSFIKIFISRILSYSFDSDNYVYYRKFFYSVYLHNDRDIVNRLNLNFLFPLKQEVKVRNFYGSWVENVRNTFALGKTVLASQLEKNMPIGKRIFLPTKTTAVDITVAPEEQKFFFNMLKKLNINFLVLASKKEATREAKYMLIIANGKCKLIANRY